MAITTNLITSSDIDLSKKAADWHLPITPHDANYLEDPVNAGRPVVTQAISFETAGALKVEYANKRVVTIPSGTLAAGIPHPMNVVKVWSTGTTALNILGWIVGEPKNPINHP